MLKRILYTLLVLLVIYSAAVVGFTIFEPVQATGRSSGDQTMLAYDSLRDYTMSTGVSSIHYYFFDASDNDSLYVQNTVLSDVQRTTGLDLSSIIETVDIYPLAESGRTDQLAQDWGISSYPAFAVFRVTADGIDVSDVLEWDDDHPFSTDQIVQWLTDNGLYNNNDPAVISPAA